MEHLFIADTNLFFECRRLEELPWAELGSDPVVIALTKPVIGEIDKHKNGGGRTRKRALDINGRIRNMLVSDQSESVLREASPRVILRLMPMVLPASELEDGLDYRQNDDRIVGIASTLSRGEHYASVSLLTHDTAVASTAKAVGVSFRLIPDSWLRPPEETTEAKRIKELEKDLATYRSQEPLITLREVEDETTAHVVRRIAEPLSPAAIDQLIDKLRSHHPMRTDFTVPAPRRLPDGTEISHDAPDPKLIEVYTTTDYPSWLAG
jgi:predicted ribonuclease YlaK